MPTSTDESYGADATDLWLCPQINGPKSRRTNISCAAGVLGRKATVLLFLGRATAVPTTTVVWQLRQRLRTEETTQQRRHLHDASVKKSLRTTRRLWRRLRTGAAARMLPDSGSNTNGRVCAEGGSYLCQRLRTKGSAPSLSGRERGPYEGKNSNHLDLVKVKGSSSDTTLKEWQQHQRQRS